MLTLSSIQRAITLMGIIPLVVILNGCATKDPRPVKIMGEGLAVGEYQEKCKTHTPRYWQNPKTGKTEGRWEKKEE